MSTQTLSSAQPTSTTTFAATQDAFSPSTSPPLILAFLAIGLFSAAMVFIFWRRIQANRSWRLTAGPPGVNRSYLELPIINNNIPKLWDLSNAGSFPQDQDEKAGAGSEVDIRWVNLMPLSLSKEVLHSPTADRSIEPRRYSLNNFLHTISNLNPLSRRRSSPSQHDDDDGDKSDDADAMQVTMQVAVTIALPTPQYPIHIRNRNSDSRPEAGENTDRQHMTDYCIGMHECPWP